MDSMIDQWQSVTAELVAEAKRIADEASSVPKGEYEGVVVKWERQVSDKESFDNGNPNLLYGVPVANCQLELYDVEGKTRTSFANMTPELVMTPGGRIKIESQRAIDLTKAVGLIGHPFNEALDRAGNVRVKYKYNEMKGEDGEKRTYLAKIKAL